MKTSIVMAVHGNWPVVERAVAAVAPELGQERELLLVDDASPEPVPAALASWVVERNAENVGFGPSCNRGAAAARGEYLCFLNSDALVGTNALAELERVADADERAAVSAFLIADDGSLQEAGRAVGRDMATYPLGHGAAPDDPMWAFCREVDYGSAACLLIRADEFNELGGFDNRYAPGYHEDVDLCLRLADRGGRTIVAPAARVVHLEHGSGSATRARALVRGNVPTLAARWGERFSHRPVVVAAHPWPHRELALRDAIPLLRFLVFGNADPIATKWPGSRVTLIGDAADGDGFERAQPEDLENWLEERRFHYSAVVGAPSGLDEALRRTQPQAARDLDDPVIPPPGGEPRG